MVIEPDFLPSRRVSRTGFSAGEGEDRLVVNAGANVHHSPEQKYTTLGVA